MLEYSQTVFFLLVAIPLLALLAYRQRKLKHMQASLDAQHQKIDKLYNDIQGLFAGAVGNDSRVLKLESRTRRLVERQEQLENNRQVARPYEEAIRMVHQGSKVEDLMAVCKLSRGEADLIMMVHSADNPEDDTSSHYH
jgi:hypothetical protein